MGLGCFFGVVVFLPAEGRIAGPLHEGVGWLLGGFSFLVPLGLVGLGVLLLVPGMVAGSRLAGLAALVLACLPILHFVGVGTGLVGAWLATLLVDWLGGPGAGVVLVAFVLLGALLAFDVTLAQFAGATVAGYRRVRSATVFGYRPTTHPPFSGGLRPPGPPLVRGKLPWPANRRT
jgi:hypothetical protein